MSAKLIAFPALVSEPVNNPKRTCGRLPKGVQSLASARQEREWQRRAAKEAERSAAVRSQPEKAEEMEPLETPSDLEALGREVQALHRAALRLSAQMFMLGKEI